MKVTRRKSRENALQILYQLDMNQDLSVDLGVDYFESYFSRHKITDDFSRQLVSGVSFHLAELDDKIKQFSDNWRTERMAVVDRNLLRLGMYELKHCHDIPRTVTIDEMIELAKQFGSENSASFVNGILDRFKTALDAGEES